MYFHVYLIYRFTRTFTDHSSVITRCWGFELQNGKSRLKSPQTLATQDFAPASFLSTPDKKHRKLRFSMLFCCKFVAKTLKMVWVKMWVNCLTHTVTHIGWQSAALPPTASSCPMGTTKCAERAKEHRRGNCFLSGALLACGTYRICAMKLPIFSAAFCCICRVAWV